MTVKDYVVMTNDHDCSGCSDFVTIWSLSHGSRNILYPLYQNRVRSAALLTLLSARATGES